MGTENVPRQEPGLWHSQSRKSTAQSQPTNLTSWQMGGGLCLLVPPSGAKLWRWRYRFDGKEKMMALGEYPLISLKEARERQAEVRKALANGIDPMAERKAEGEAKQKEVEARQREAENSFENVAREWWKWWKIGKSPRHADTTMRRMEADVFPAYGHKSINAVTAADVRELMISVEERDARDVAKRIHETTSQIFRFAIARDVATRNPAADFKPRDILAEAQTENRARVDAKELPELLVKIDDYKGDAITRLAMKLMTYTFVRTQRRDRSALVRVRFGRGPVDHSGGAHEDEDSAYRSAVPSGRGGLTCAEADHGQRPLRIRRRS